MTLEPLDAAPAIIQLHAWSAMAAFGIGVVMLARPKGTHAHRLTGRVWVALMLVVAGSSLFIHTIRQWGPFSWIHLLSLLTLIALPIGVWRIRRGDVAGHKRTMVSLFVGALVIAGFFTFVPGRIMHDVLFHGSTEGTALTIAVFALAVAAVSGWGLWNAQKARSTK